MAAEWRVPTMMQRTTCINHFRWEICGADGDGERRDKYPTINLEDSAIEDDDAQDELLGQSHHDEKRHNFVINAMGQAWSAISCWLWTKPFYNSINPTLCKRERMAWHPNKVELGIVQDEKITIFEEGALLQGGSGASHEIQGVYGCKYNCLAFRPNSPGDISAGSDAGLQLFTKSLPQLTRSTLLCQDTGSYGMRILGSGIVDCISWHPLGHLIASAGPTVSGFSIWDANLEQGTRMGVAMERVHLLRWSPSGKYLAAASQNTMFYLWETSSWRVKSWDCGKWGNVISAEWHPKDSLIILAFEKASTLIVVHVTQDPPALDTQWNGLDLPQLYAVTPNGNDAPLNGSGCVDWMTWDSSGSRLAVSLKAPHPADGCIAIFDTATRIGLNPMFQGFARVLPSERRYSRQSLTHMVFQPNCKDGALLGVCQGRRIAFLPMIFNKINR